MNIFPVISGIILLGVPGVAFAGTWLPSTPCGGLLGCGGGPANAFSTSVAVDIAIMMLQIAAGLAVLFIVWSGFQMIINRGDEGNVTKARQHIVYALIGLMVAILSQLIVTAVISQQWVSSAAATELPIDLLAAAVSVLRTLINGVLIIVIVVAGIYMLLDHGKQDSYKKGKVMLQWAIIGAIVVNLANALVQAIASYFGV